MKKENEINNTSNNENLDIPTVSASELESGISQTEETKVNDTVVESNNQTSSQDTDAIKTNSENINQPQETIQTEVTQITPSVEVDPVNVEISTEKVKSPSNAIFFVIILILGIIVFFMDDILDFFTEDNYYFYNEGSSNSTSNNLVKDYIQIGKENSYVEVNNIRFYNFKIGNDKKILLDYTTNKNIKNSSSLNIFIMIFDGEENLIYKHLFNDGNIDRDTVKQYVLNVDNDVYLSAYYAKVKMYNEQGLLAETTLNCNYSKTDNEVNQKYQIVYTFKNDFLSRYTVNKEVTGNDEQTSYTTHINSLADEKNKAEAANIKVDSPNENKISYMVTLSSDLNGFTPLYNSDDLLYNIKYKETLKGWKCE